MPTHLEITINLGYHDAIFRFSVDHWIIFKFVSKAIYFTYCACVFLLTRAGAGDAGVSYSLLTVSERLTVIFVQFFDKMA